jgi:hypothetical protein
MTLARTISVMNPQLSNRMGQGLSPKAGSYDVAQQIPCFYNTRMFVVVSRKTTILNPILSQLNCLHYSLFHTGPFLCILVYLEASTSLFPSRYGSTDRADDPRGRTALGSSKGVVA